MEKDKDYYRLVIDDESCTASSMGKSPFKMHMNPDKLWLQHAENEVHRGYSSMLTWEFEQGFKIGATMMQEYIEKNDFILEREKKSNSLPVIESKNKKYSIFDSFFSFLKNTEKTYKQKPKEKF
jgi:hypothetical protein